MTSHSDLHRSREAQHSLLGGASQDAPVARFALAALLAGLCVQASFWALTDAMGSTGALAGLTAYLVAVSCTGWAFRKTYPHGALGFCNVVTLVRLAMVCLLAGALFDDAVAGSSLILIAVAAFALDGADGWFARSAGLTSDFGARFDVEVDSAFALILSILAVQAGLHPAVILLGLPRYGFGLAQLVSSRLNGALKERFSRKVVCVVQIATLIFLIMPWVDPTLRHVAAFLCGAVVAWSFAVDIRALLKASA